MEQSPSSEILFYQTEDERTRVEVRFDDNSAWLTQAQMAELFQTTPQNITLHLRSIYEEGELQEMATCKDYLQVRFEGKRQVQRNLRHYNLEAILAVGYRVRSLRVVVNRFLWQIGKSDWMIFFDLMIATFCRMQVRYLGSKRINSQMRNMHFLKNAAAL